jgi:2-C-methyl-D-erythritol 4-phosphate cytidylyltransferase
MIVGGVIVAAGRGERFGATGKILADVAGRPMLAWSLEAFAQSGSIRDVVIVAGAHTLDAVHSLVEHGSWPKVRTIVEGGTERSQSVRCGVQALANDVDVCVIQDAARPLVTVEFIERAAAVAAVDGAAIVAVPVTDTLKRTGSGGLVTETVDRATLWAAQTPQAFRRAALIEAFASAESEGCTDEAMLFERLGLPVRIVNGSRDNVKVTVPEDLPIADFLLRSRLDTT